MLSDNMAGKPLPLTKRHPTSRRPPPPPPPLPPLDWEAHARAGRLADAIAAYVARMDWTTFVELEQRLAPYFEVEGNASIELAIANTFVWTGMSEPFAEAVLQLIDEGRLHLHPATSLTYVLDGGVLRLPVAKSPPPGGYARPRWLPVLLRVVPIDNATGNQIGLLKRRAAVR
jgi:hypothetical protein